MKGSRGRVSTPDPPDRIFDCSGFVIHLPWPGVETRPLRKENPPLAIPVFSRLESSRQPEYCSNEQYLIAISASTEKVISLRALLKEQFPEAHRQVVPNQVPPSASAAVAMAETSDEDTDENHLSLGVASLDSLGVLVPGVLAEITGRRLSRS